MDEGYIKFTCNWTEKSSSITDDELSDINLYRSKLMQMGMIGKITNGPGFGNISCKSNNNTFIITGSNTGGIKTLNSSHISHVTDVNIEANSILCNGLTIASSESMSHAIIYKSLSSANAIIHIHHNRMWSHYKNKLPTTDNKIAYGTPEMAYAILEKVKDNSTDKILILGGHEDGIIVFGESLRQCYDTIKNLFSDIK